MQVELISRVREGMRKENWDLLPKVFLLVTLGIKSILFVLLCNGFIKKKIELLNL